MVSVVDPGEVKQQYQNSSLTLEAMQGRVTMVVQHSQNLQLYPTNTTTSRSNNQNQCIPVRLGARYQELHTGVRWSVEEQRCISMHWNS